MRVPVLVVLLVALAGCTNEGPSYRLGGSFTTSFTEADRADFTATVEAYGADVAFLESFPEQFSITHIHEGCEELRLKLDAKSYVANVGMCMKESGSHGGDQPTSSP